MAEATRERGSFRDPAGRVYSRDGRILRAVFPPGRAAYEAVRDSGLLTELADSGLAVTSVEVAPDLLGAAAPDACYVLEHPRIPFISHPYEWPFAGLQAAALLTLDLHLKALDYGMTLSDASAYNVQFDGPRPVFIDILSLVPYREGQYWAGHRQFCEQFLNPLLLTAYTGVPYQAWYRGTLEGLTAAELSPLLPWRRRLSWRVLLHVGLQARFQSGAAAADAAKLSTRRPLSRVGFRGLLSSMRAWVARLAPPGGPTVWSGYAAANSYAADEARRKAAFVAAFAAAVRPALLWDLGCNTGDYSAAALAAGAGRAIGFDLDHGALDGAFRRARTEGLALLPLYGDAANPAPNQGWDEGERLGLQGRAAADGLLALALIHHLAIARNIPLAEVVDWLVRLAPAGVVEFVPKSDPMVQRLLALRPDIFPDYTEAHFLECLNAQASVVRTERVTDSGRLLAWYQRS